MPPFFAGARSGSIALVFALALALLVVGAASTVIGKNLTATIELAAAAALGLYGGWRLKAFLACPLTESIRTSGEEASVQPASAVRGWCSADELRNAITADIAQGIEAGVLAVIRWADYDRVARFDAHAAERFLLLFQTKLRAIVAKERVIGYCEHNCFAIWLPSDTAEVSGELRAIKYALGADLQTTDGTLIPEVQVSGAFYPEDATDADALLIRARIMRLALGDNGGTLRLLREPISDLSNDFALGQHLRRAIERNELELYYQPLINADTADLVGAEALLRWTSREIGNVSPNRFIPVMERIGLADQIGNWILNQACKNVANWRRSGFSGLKVAVNVSHKQLASPLLERVVEGMLDRHGLEPATLELELTESAATRDIERAQKFFSRMSAIGVRIAIDDFGTGYSSLSYLKQLRFQKLKIDREFITNVDESADSQAICQSLVALARGLEIDILAEGVETRAEVEYMRSIGCPLFQGYYFSKPLPATEFLDFICSADWMEKLAPQVSRNAGLRKRGP